MAASAKDFQALRNTFMEVMEGAKVPESTVKLLVSQGHSLTFGHYSKGTRVTLREAVQEFAYPADVFDLIERPAKSRVPEA